MNGPASRLRACLAAAGLGAALLALACGEDEPTGLGSGFRDTPDTLRTVDFFDVLTDSVFAVPVSLGRSPVGQIGRRFPYTAHLLYVFDLPTRAIVEGDTLSTDTATLVVRTDSLLQAPFRGTMRLGLREVSLAARAWEDTTILSGLPAVDADELGPDVVLADSQLVNRVTRLSFALNLSRIEGFAAARDSGRVVEVHAALVFQGFAAAGERGFLEIPFQDAAGNPTAQVVAFSNEQTAAIATVTPRTGRRRSVVDFDPAYSPGSRLVVSDGYRLHSYLRFAPLGRALPESAVVHRADLYLTLADTLAGDSFGSGPAFGVMVPSDSTKIFERSENERAFARGFTAPLEAVPGAVAPLQVTLYAYDIQEGRVQDRGMLLRLSNEGTKARHFEFFGSAAADSLRPRLRIVYGLPSRFEREP